MKTLSTHQSKPVVLLAEDDVEQRELYAAVLRQHGLIVEVATDGIQAVAFARQLRPALVLLDMMLPKMSGMEVLQDLKTDSRTQAIPVVAITGLPSADLRHAALQAGCVTYLNKPYSPMALVAEVMHWLPRTRVPSAPLS